MVSGVRLTGDYGTLQRDLSRLSTNFGIDSKYEFDKVLASVGRFWVKTYNNYLKGDNHPTLAKAKFMKLSHGKLSRVSVSLSEKAIMYSTMKNHYVSAKHPYVRRWIKRRWNYNKDNFYKWTASERHNYSPPWSNIHGSYVNPSGSLYVKGFIGKRGFNPIEQTHKESLDEMQRQLKQEVPSALRRVLNKSLTKKVYNVKIVMTL